MKISYGMVLALELRKWLRHQPPATATSHCGSISTLCKALPKLKMFMFSSV